MEIRTRTSVEAWRSLLSHVISSGSKIPYKDETAVECLNVLVTVTEPQRKPEEPISLLNSFGKWVYPSLEEIAENLLSDKKDSNYVYTYGSRIRGGLNQIDDFLIPLLEQKPDSGRAVLVLWDPRVDSTVKSQESPGIVFFDFKLRGALHTTAIIRNNNIFFGWPANIYQGHAIQKHVASKLGVKIGTLSTMLCSAHIFEGQVPYARKIVGRKIDD